MVFELLCTLGLQIQRQLPISVFFHVVRNYEGFCLLESLKIFDYRTPERLIIDIKRLHSYYFFHIVSVKPAPFGAGGVITDYSIIVQSTLYAQALIKSIALGSCSNSLTRSSL